MKVLVTGATGFIGSHLVEVLHQEGVQVRCLVRKTADLKWLRSLPVEIVHGDCTNGATLAEAVDGVGRVFHLAGVTKAVREETYFQVNAIGTENLVRACIENNPDLQKFIYVSSQAAAGPCRNGDLKKESDQCEPISLYGRSKRMGEELALKYVPKLPLVILRPCAIYGPRERDIYTFFKILSKGINPSLSRQDQHISLCYVRDVVQAILSAAEVPSGSGEIFFVSDGHDYRMEEIADVFAKALGTHPISIPIPYWAISGVASLSEHLSKFTKKPPLLNKGKVEEMTQRNWVCDISKAKSLLDFEPQVSLSEGARLTVEWYRKEKWL